MEMILNLKPTLDKLYADFNYADSAADPIQIVRRFGRADDREIVAFCAAALAFGRVASVLQSIERLIAIMGDQPAAYIRTFRPERERRAFKGLVHRWIRETDLLALVWILRQIADEAGSIEAYFTRGYDSSHADTGAALESFSRRALALDVREAYGAKRSKPGVSYFFPRPSSGSACKRMNLFLRWMVRRDALDLGVWSSVKPASLVVPLDTHVIRVSRCLRLTRYTSPGWAMARHHGLVAEARSRGSGEIRLRDVPPRHDGRLRIQPSSGGRSVSVARGLSTTAAYTSAVAFTIRSSVNRCCRRSNPARPNRSRKSGFFKSSTIALARR
jgi:uncharacterized protein (TIGR02757 family)